MCMYNVWSSFRCDTYEKAACYYLQTPRVDWHEPLTNLTDIHLLLMENPYIRPSAASLISSENK